MSKADLADVERAERQALTRRSALLRSGRPPDRLDGRTAIVVDDGVATGATARVACLATKERGAARVVLAVPVASRAALRAIVEADEIVSAEIPDPFGAVGRYYADFGETSDDDVVRVLAGAAARTDGIDPGVPRPGGL